MIATIRIPLFVLLSASLFGADATAVKNRPPLAASSFYPLPLTSVKPSGWVLDQLRIQADGLTGHLDEFWPDLGPNSGWLGGTGESWERGPYYLDGLVPLAYLTGDAKLIAKAKKWVDWTLENQRPDGALGPQKNTDWWPVMVMLKVLTQYQEATGDPRVIPAMQRYFAYQARNLDERPLKQWAIFRWQDEVLSILWLYNRTGEKELLDLAQKLHDRGHDWQAQFATFRYPAKVTKGEMSLATHGVNNAMALKTAAVWSLVSGQARDREASYEMLAKLDRYHQIPNHMFSATEHYAGTDPSQGVELCAVVEAMFSLETNIGILGDPLLADRLEKITFNALPGTFTADMWAHQYDQQPNQVMCSLSKRDWTDNGPDANLFGLEPHFGCCTANMHQGWPKFAASLWMATAGDGLAAIAYSPSEVRTVVRGGVPVTVIEDTEYPFRETITLTVNPQRAVEFPLELRIPKWAAQATVTVNGQGAAGVQAGTFFKVERRWQPGDKVEIRLPMQVQFTHWQNNSVAVERGPLIYSLAVGENWRKFKQTGPATDWEVYPTTPWNYALVMDEKTLQFKESPVAKQPFNPKDPPVEIQAKGRRVPEWQLVNDSAGAIPPSPVVTKQPEESLRLVPYGAAKLRVTAFPFVAQ